MGGRAASPRLSRLSAGKLLPHYDGEADRRPSYHRLLAGGQSRLELLSKIGPEFTTEKLRFIALSRLRLVPEPIACGL